MAAGLLAVYPPLSIDQSCDVAIVGAGITGALVADALSEAGLEVILLDRRDVASGSTAASTALLSYELDVELQDLIPLVGEDVAVRAYELSLGAITTLERLTQTLNDDCGFARRPSLYVASEDRDVPRLEREVAIRNRYGLPAELWDGARISASYDFPARAGLRSPFAAEVDPYRLTHALLARARDRGARIFDRTAMTGCERHGGVLVLTTDRGGRVRAEQVVFALGYEIPASLRRDLVKLVSTYAIVTEPLSSFARWEDRCLLWETARPYRYARSTIDGRLILGGEDEPIRDPARRDRLLPEKGRLLTAHFRELFPALDAEPAFSWTGTFGETEDGLPYVAEHPRLPGAVFALGYGGNGITFGAVAADLIRDLCLGRRNHDLELFRLDREPASSLLRA